MKSASALRLVNESLADRNLRHEFREPIFSRTVAAHPQKHSPKAMAGGVLLGLILAVLLLGAFLPH
jgi:hypothetical protein